MRLLTAVLLLLLLFIYDVSCYVKEKNYMTLSSCNKMNKIEVILFAFACAELGSVTGLNSALIALTLYFPIEICSVNIIYLCRTGDRTVVKKTACAAGILLAIGAGLLAAANFAQYIVRNYI